MVNKGNNNTSSTSSSSKHTSSQQQQRSGESNPQSQTPDRSSIWSLFVNDNNNNNNDSSIEVTAPSKTSYSRDSTSKSSTDYSTESNASGELNLSIQECAEGKTNNKKRSKKKKKKTVEHLEASDSDDSIRCEIVLPCTSRVHWILSACLVLVLLVGSIVAYVMASSAEDPTLSPSVSPSSSPTLPFLNPPSPEDCDRVRNGEALPAAGQQESMEVRNFDLVLDVAIRVLESQSGRGGVFARIQTIDQLQAELQQRFIAKLLVGCGDADAPVPVPSNRRRLRHTSSHHQKRMLSTTTSTMPNNHQYIVGNGKVEWVPASIEEMEECSSRMCFRVTFNMELFLKSAEERHFSGIESLVTGIVGDDLVDSLELESPVLVSVVARSVIYHAPTKAPSSMPSLVPSVSPTQTPTELPSKLPTQTPSQGPSFQPTREPSFSPSMAPTFTPTTSPPTLAPSMYPTTTPTTMGPTQSPSMHPTLVPSNHPSSGPSGEFDGLFQPLDRPIKVACVGDSLTLGRSGGNPSEHSYPFQLRQMLGENFDVYNFGRNAVTAIRGMSLSYVDQMQFQSSLDAEPDIYLLMLGTNDARYWQEQGHKFREDMEWIVNKVRSISPESPARIIVAIPPWVKTDVYGIRNDILVNNVQPEIQTLARQENLQLVNMYDVTFNQADQFLSDGLHLNDKGYGTLATNWKEAIQCNQNGFCEVGETCSTCPGDCYLNCS